MEDRSSSSKTTERRNWIPSISLIIVLVVVASAVIWYVVDRHETGDQANDIGAGVTIEDPDFDVRLEASLVADANTPLNMMEPVSEVFSIGPSGPLASTTTITLPLLQSVPDDEMTIVFTAESVAGPWSPLPTVITSNGSHATFQVDHLSLFTALRINTTEVLRVLKTEIFDGLTGNFIAEAEHPQCEGEDQARGDGYSIASTQGDTVYWCFGIENQSRVLKVVNNRRYPLLMEYPGLTVVSQSNNELWAGFAEFMAGKSKVAVLPRAQAVFGVDVSAGQRASVDTSADAMGQHTYAAFTGGQALLDILTRFGAGAGTATIDSISRLIGAADCYQQIGDPAGDILNACLSPDDVLDAFGLWGVVLAPIMATGEVANYFRSVFNGVGDLVTNRDNYQIVITRKQVRRLPEVCGTIYDKPHSRDVRVTMTQGRTTCPEALQLADTYYNNPPAIGSSGVAVIGDWQCTSRIAAASGIGRETGQCIGPYREGGTDGHQGARNSNLVELLPL